MGHGDLLQSEKETLSFKESHGYCQKGEKKKKKDRYDWAGLFEVAGGGGSWLMLNGDIQCILEGIDEAQMGREKCCLYFFILPYSMNLISSNY